MWLLKIHIRNNYLGVFITYLSVRGTGNGNALRGVY